MLLNPVLRRPVESTLAALIRVVNHRLGLAGHQCHVQRKNHQVRGHALSKGPTDHLAAVDVDDHGHVQKSCPSRYVGHVCHPQLVDVGGPKLPIYQVQGRTMSNIALGCDTETAPATNPAHVLLAHQNGNAFAAGHNACIHEFSTNAGHAVRFIAGDKRLTDLRRQRDVGVPTLAYRSAQPAVETAGRDLEGFAHGAHG